MSSQTDAAPQQGPAPKPETRCATEEPLRALHAVSRRKRNPRMQSIRDLCNQKTSRVSAGVCLKVFDFAIKCVRRAVLQSEHVMTTHGRVMINASDVRTALVEKYRILHVDVSSIAHLD